MNETTSRDPQPRPECDIIMKGGITSGIVYPPAILALRSAGYRFRSIGGASAGAIAAAAVAAAQYGEANGGFDELAKLNADLGRGRFVADLFRTGARADAAAVLDLALAVQKATGPGAVNPSLMGREDTDEAAKRGFRWSHVVDAMSCLTKTQEAMRTTDAGAYEAGVARSTRAATWAAVALGGAVFAVGTGCAIAALLLAGRDGIATAAVALVPALVAVGLAFGLARALGGMLEALSWLFSDANFHGLSMGYDPKAGDTTLVGWLDKSLAAMAGKDRQDPLTFGDLAHAPGEPIELKMVTTDLSLGRPFMLPFETHDLVFRASEMRRLFPEHVVAYMIRAGAELDDGSRRKNVVLPNGYHWLPTGDKMPVIVATRLSLSFPVLLAAVPLYRVKNEHWRSRKPEAEQVFDDDTLERRWFSDGGISSNFPIHFFDRWMPDRPTFGINLTRTRDSGARPLLPGARETPASDLPWSNIQGMVSFLWAIVDTAMSYRDNLQAQLPSYRERIVQVPLADHEGGLNLEMDDTVIHEIQGKGRDAGDLLVKRFDFDQHRWVRFRVLGAHLEQELRFIKAPFLGNEPAYKGVLDAQRAARDEARSKADAAKKTALAEGRSAREAEQRWHEVFDEIAWYRPEDDAWCQGALERMVTLMRGVDGWDALPPHGGPARGKGQFFASGAPKPQSLLRVTPRF
jgi:predicted acylesterase/phospholipase RssA